MADTRNIKRNMSRLKRIKTWQLFALLVVMGFVTATFLRLNNVGMIQMRDAVLSADKAGDATVTRDRLYDLQRYVSTHMNADMGTIYLEGQYRRDSQKLLDAASNDDNPNGNVFKKAQEICAPKYAHLGHYSQAFEQCVTGQLDSFGSAGELTSQVNLPKVEQYRFGFVAPLWSPDFAGFSVLVCLLIVLVIVGRLVSLGILKLILKLRNREP